jgi:LuxR family maltose regulon positive regulatory protein
MRPLTRAELEVLRCLSRGLTGQGAADALGKALGTVRKQLFSTCEKLGAGNRTQAVAVAIRAGLIE